jgi:hypothetical protein
VYPAQRIFHGDLPVSICGYYTIAPEKLQTLFAVAIEIGAIL